MKKSDLAKLTPLRKWLALAKSVKFQGRQAYYSFTPLLWNIDRHIYGFDCLKLRVTWKRPVVWQFRLDDGTLFSDYHSLIPQALLPKPLP